MLRFEPDGRIIDNHGLLIGKVFKFKSKKRGCEFKAEPTVYKAAELRQIADELDRLNEAKS